MAINTEKKTQAQMFAEIAGILSKLEGTEEYVEFLDGRIELLENQAARAKERKANKEKPEDPMLAAVLAQVGEKLKTGDEIAAALEAEFPEISRSKVVARLKVLIDQGLVGKISVKAGAGKRVMAYALKEYMPADEDAE